MSRKDLFWIAAMSSGRRKEAAKAGVVITTFCSDVAYKASAAC